MLGDIGGLFSALKGLFGPIVAHFSNFVLKTTFLTTFFKFKESNDN